jgi:hypothetical protein
MFACHRRGRPFRGLTRHALHAVTAVAFTVTACDPKVSRVERGGECFTASDCVPGLVCIEGADQVRVCSDQIEQIAAEPIDAGRIVSPRDSGADDAGDAGDAR